MTKEKTIIEVKGVKLEVDMTEATQIHTYKIGDKVKVLVKKYGDDFIVCPGIIIAFSPFVDLPTIEVAYLESSYSSHELKLASINAKSKDFEMCPVASDELSLNKIEVLKYFDREILKKEREIEDIQSKRDYFLRRFGNYLECVSEELQ